MSTPPSPSAPSPLVGRERELRVLRERLTTALTGRGSLVLIGGEAGIGKTMLAATACADAERQGALVLVGRCFDLAETPPTAPGSISARATPPPPRSPRCPPPSPTGARWGPSPARWPSSYRCRISSLPSPPTGPLFSCWTTCTGADSASLDLLRFLTPILPTLPFLILVTYRADELTRRHPLSRLLPQLARDAATTRLNLGRLTDDAVRTLLRERYRLSDADQARLAPYLHDRAEGNPLFTGELLRALEEGGMLRATEEGWRLGHLSATAVPALLRQVIEGRVARLDAESQRLLAVAAVIGHDVPFDVWIAVGEVGEDYLLDLAESAEEARVLTGTPDGAGVRFAHALIREALYEGIPAVRRRRIHRRAGEALAERHHVDADAVAFQFQRADDDRALPWLLAAGERAQAAYAWTTAAMRFEAALALMERADTDAGARGWLLLRLARLLRYTEVTKARAFADESYALGLAANNGALTAYARFQRGLLGCLAPTWHSASPNWKRVLWRWSRSPMQSG